MRLYLTLAGLKRRMTLGSRVMMIDPEQRIYLVRHTYLHGWHLPGGGVEPGESAAESAAREVLEESGYRVTEPLKLFGLYHSTLVTNRDHVAFFLCRGFERQRPFSPNHEIAEFNWFALDALPETTSGATLRRVAEVFHGAPQSLKW
ncbi:MAG: NUDIX domain-containing protein [Devosia sp.]|jgi:8-oxo-dGTP pyrophosphatase MutT (NUDIX family)